MSKVKGYVVRGKDCDGALYMTGAWGYARFASGIPIEMFGDLGAASSAWCNLSTCEGVRDVRIFAVAEDGTETLLPTYEEALAQIHRIIAATTGIGFTGPEDSATERVDLLLTSRDSIARQRDELQASVGALDALKEALKTLFGAARTLLDAHETTYHVDGRAMVAGDLLQELDAASEEARPLAEDDTVPPPAPTAPLEHSGEPGGVCGPCSEALRSPSPCVMSHDVSPGAYPPPEPDLEPAAGDEPSEAQ